MEECANEGKPSDGEVYKKIRNYQSQKQSSLEMRWWTLLSTHRARNLKQLLRHREFVSMYLLCRPLADTILESLVSVAYQSTPRRLRPHISSNHAQVRDRGLVNQEARFD